MHMYVYASCVINDFKQENSDMFMFVGLLVSFTQI